MMNNLTINLNETCTNTQNLKSPMPIYMNPFWWITICFPDPKRDPLNFIAQETGENDQISEESKFSELEFIRYVSDEVIPKLQKRKDVEGIHEDLEQVYIAYPKMKGLVSKALEPDSGSGGGTPPTPIMLCGIIIVLLVVFLAGLIVGYRAGRKKKKKK